VKAESRAETLLAQARQFLRDERWGDAVEALEVLVAEAPDPQSWALLARASLEKGNPRRALVAIAELPDAVRRHVAIERIRIVALARLGKEDQALAAAERFLRVVPDDPVMVTLKARLGRPPAVLGAGDPVYRVGQAEAYAADGDLQRAARVYRRIRRYHPENAQVRRRLLHLEQRLSKQQQ
jgi:tetratricopeptide (TPR) repeat protein